MLEDLTLGLEQERRWPAENGNVECWIGKIPGNNNLWMIVFYGPYNSENAEIVVSIRSGLVQPGGRPNFGAYRMFARDYLTTYDPLVVACWLSENISKARGLYLGAPADA